MAAKSRSTIIADLEAHMAANGGVFTEWYVGVTDRPKHQLFTVHRLQSSGDAWISRKAPDDLQAGEVAEFFRTVRHTRGGTRPETLDHVFVYAYRLKPHTRP
ncbi:hypothetical protein GALL_208270 [mine drainage metagenome]|uniref:Uncharacterized protein n=1 Tax=mine drainage metagenome TaxID=410659 RepID=A0A1J5RLP6_9ZZZZ